MDINDWFEQARRYLEQNQFASGGLFLGLLGGVAALCRHLPGRIVAQLWRRISVEVEVTSKDDLFDAVEYWLSHAGLLKRARNFRARFREMPPTVGDSDSYDHEEAGAGRSRDPGSHVELAPGPGRHWFWHGGRLVLLDRESREKEKGQEGQTIEAFRFHILSRNLEATRAFLAEAIRSCRPDGQRVVRVMTSYNNYWRVRAAYPARPASSLVLPVGLYERLEADIARFYARREWYRTLGLPYRRGYLLAGPPGNGKTSTIVVLAGIFQAPVCVIDLGSGLMNDERLRDLISDTPAGAFLLFEDIDAVVRNRDSRPSEEGPDDGPLVERVTLSGLLNALDGVATPEGRIVFMSTNYPERLDPALVRPGRIDLRLDFGNASPEQLRRLFLRFHAEDFPGREALADRFAGLLGDGTASMAKAQGILLEGDGDPHVAIEMARREGCEGCGVDDPGPRGAGGPHRGAAVELVAAG